MTWRRLDGVRVDEFLLYREKHGGQIVPWDDAGAAVTDRIIGQTFDLLGDREDPRRQIGEASIRYAADGEVVADVSFDPLAFVTPVEGYAFDALDRAEGFKLLMAMYIPGGDLEAILFATVHRVVPFERLGDAEKDD